MLHQWMRCLEVQLELALELGSPSGKSIDPGARHSPGLGQEGLGGVVSYAPWEISAFGGKYEKTCMNVHQNWYTYPIMIIIVCETSWIGNYRNV